MSWQHLLPPQPLSPPTHMHSYTLLPALLLPAAAGVVEQEGNQEGGVQGLSYQRLTGWAVTQSVPQLVPLSGHSSPHPPASLPPLAGSLLPFKPLHPHSAQARKEAYRSMYHAKTSPVQERKRSRRRQRRTERIIPVLSALAATSSRCVCLCGCGARRGQSNSPSPRRAAVAQGVSTG